MFQHPAFTAQLAADRRFARTAAAAHHSAARRRGHTAAESEAAVTPRAIAGAAGSRQLSIPQPGSTGFERFAADLGEHIAAGGTRSATRQIEAVVRLARSRCIGTALAAIVADPAQPAVARERALGRLLATLAMPADGGRRAARAAA